MTQTLAPARHDAAVVLSRAAALGVALGVADLVLIRLLPYPLADLANSSAVWALAAFVLGRSLRVPPGLAAAAGAVLLVVGVASYYLAAAVVDLASLASFVTPTTLSWYAMAVVAGAGFGAAGAVSTGPVSAGPAGWAPSGAVALVVGVLLAEAWLRRALPDTALLTVAVALAVLAATSRGPASAVRAAALCVPLGVLCVAGFALAGF
ncbi:DUF6518 family protein [Nocardioides rubriscoriae]|uniref:DUF6518 family protein n=1 Tax=Nocardioides rubriscoriae TaxID=642762 RepID=UPI0011DF4013|nr:DUF6518 family protein [Nocardioides rubriscoriae]